MIVKQRYGQHYLKVVYGSFYKLYQAWRSTHGYSQLVITNNYCTAVQGTLLNERPPEGKDPYKHEPDT